MMLAHAVVIAPTDAFHRTGARISLLPFDLGEAAVPFGVDGNGALTEITSIGGIEVIVHHDDLPPSDITVVHGIPCTTALRTVIDLAPELEPDALERMLRDCLDRRLFTVADAGGSSSSFPDPWARFAVVCVASRLSW